MKTDDPLAQLRHLAPLRDLPEAERLRLGVRREGRGRPRQIAPPPEQDNYLEQLDTLRWQATTADPVVSAASDPGRAAQVLDQAIFQLAVECGSLAFDRIQAEKRGLEIGPLCSRRISGLAQIASLVVLGQRYRKGEPDVRGDKFQTLVRYFHEAMAQCAREMLASEDAERFLGKYRELVTGWEDKIDPRSLK
jgi:hypothetical protein